MLQSEFYERTKVNLTPEEYAKVEAVYNEVKMEKDEFCKEWLKLRNDKLMGEIADAMYAMACVISEKQQQINHLKGQLVEKDRCHTESVDKLSKQHGERLVELAKRIVRASVDEKMIQDVIEEEFGYPFIIRTKHEAGIPLSEAEISYMVGKL